MNWDASSCINSNSHSLVFTDKTELKMYHGTWAVAFSESALQVWFMNVIVRENMCSLGY